ADAESTPWRARPWPHKRCSRDRIPTAHSYSALDLKPPCHGSSGLSRPPRGLHVWPIQIERSGEAFFVLFGKLGQQLHFGNARAIKRIDVRPVDLDQISRGIAQIHLD